MKKTILSLALSSLLVPVTVLAQDVEKTSQLTQSETLVLKKETYEGEAVVRYFEYEKSKTPYISFIEVPESIQKEVSEEKREDKVKEAIARLAVYYDEVDNISKLNELFYFYTPYSPNSRIDFDDKYAPLISERLYYSLNYLDKNKGKNVPKIEMEFATDTYNAENIEKEIIPHKTEKKLYKEVESLANDLAIKWYERKITYVILGVLFISVFTVSILRKRR